MNMLPRVLCVIAAVSFPATPVYAASGYVGPWFGAGYALSGDNNRDLNCGPQVSTYDGRLENLNQAVVGIVGRSGTLVDSMQGVVCAILMVDGKWGYIQPTDAAPYTDVRIKASNDGSGGYAFRLQCPVNSVVVGIDGRTGDRLDALALKCGFFSQAADGSLVMTSTTRVGPVGGNGGAAFADNCPTNTMIYGLLSIWNVADHLTRALRMTCDTGPFAAQYGIKSFVLSKDWVVPGESITANFTLLGPAGKNDNVKISDYTSSEFSASPGWTLTIPPRTFSGGATITAASNAVPGHTLDLRSNRGIPGGHKIITVVRSDAAMLQSASLNPTQMYEGAPATLTVTLTNPAHSENIITGNSSPDGLYVEGFGFVSGTTSRSVPTRSGSGWNCGQAAYLQPRTTTPGDTGKQVSYMILCNEVGTLAINYTTDGYGQKQYFGTVTLLAPAYYRTRTVALSSSDTSCLQVPGPVTIPINATQARFTIKVVSMCTSSKSPPAVAAAIQRITTGSQVYGGPPIVKTAYLGQATFSK